MPRQTLYAESVSVLAAPVPQTQPLDSRQVENHAGGYVYEVDDRARLMRFLICGAEAGYYSTKSNMGVDNAKCVMRLLADGRGNEVVEQVVAVSTEGRAPKQGTCIFVLAMCVRLGDVQARQHALAALPLICRTASTLFEFVEQCKVLGSVAAAQAGSDAAKPKVSWGRAMRRAVATWYLRQDPAALAYQVTKYRNRSGWTHRDLLRLSHPDVGAHVAKRTAAADTAVAAGPSQQSAEEQEVAGAVNAMPKMNEADLRVVLAYAARGTVPEVPVASATAAMEEEAAALGLDEEPWELMMGSSSVSAPAGTPPAGTSCSRSVAEYIVAADRLRLGISCRPQPMGTPAGGKKRKTSEGEQEVEAMEVVASTSAGEEEDATEVVGSTPTQTEVELAALLEAAVQEACELIKKYRFSWEHVGDSTLLRQPQLWCAMLEAGLPMTALMRNLGRLSALGVTNSEEHLGVIVSRLTSERAIQGSRLHPLSLLEALRVYGKGCGDKGGLSWTPEKKVLEALEAAFYLAFKNVPPTGKRFLLGVDVSGSMSAPVMGMNLDARTAAAVMSMALLRTEENVQVMGFCDDFVELPLKRDMKLARVMDVMGGLPFGMTDCAMPMIYAAEKKIPMDVFVVMTDNETYYGNKHPMVALREYKQAMGINAALVVMAFSATQFTIADPEEPRMLDIAGLDSAVPQILRSFCLEHF